MYFYSVGYTSWEDSDYIPIYHEKQFSKEEFDAMVVNASLVAAQSHLLNNVLREEEEANLSDAHRAEYEHKWKTEDKDWEYSSENWRRRVTYDRIYEEVANELCILYGFQKVEFVQRYCLFGWANLTSKELDWEENTSRSKEYQELSKVLKADLIFPQINLPPMTDGAKELLEKLENGEISREELWDLQRDATPDRYNNYKAEEESE